MTKPKISIVVAITNKNRSIGKGGALLVRIPDDLKRFKQLTLGHPIIMGRKTYESIGRALPGRTNLVVTRNPKFRAPDVITCASLDEAVAKAMAEEESKVADQEVFIIGGGEIYAQALARTDRIYLTLVKSDTEGDVFFPDYSGFKARSKEERRDEKTGLEYSWIDLER